MIAAIVSLAVSLANLPAMAPGFAVSENDYPAFALRYHHEGVAQFDVAVDTTGVPHDCFVVVSSTFSELDARTCEIVLARMRFTPAHDTGGRAIASRFAGRLRWKIEQTAEDPFVDRTTVTTVTFKTDGSVADCKTEPAGSRRSELFFVCGDLPPGLNVLLGMPLTDLAAARFVYVLRPGADTVGHPEQLAGSLVRMAISASLTIAPDGRIASCTPVEAVMSNREISNPCSNFATGSIAFSAVPAGTERRGITGFYIYIQPRARSK